MLFWLILFLIFIGILVIYLSLDKKSDNIKEVKYEDKLVLEEFKNVQILQDDIKQLFDKVKNYIVWTDNLVKAIIISILADDHILVEWMPWLAKTRTILVFSKLLWLDFKRIQFTPDMLPSDIIWGEIYNKNTWKFETFLWPIFTNLLLADEINRATPKVQSALLEAMQERKVTIWNKTYSLPKPFFVMATENPIEQEWTFPLPEAQLDRFLMKTLVDYPSSEDEEKILNVFDKKLSDLISVFDKEEILSLQEKIKDIKVSDEIKKLIVDIIWVLRQDKTNLVLAPSPRWSIALLKVSKVIAFLEGRDSVSVEDIKRSILPTLRHRVKLSYQALSKWLTADDVILQNLLKVKNFSL